MHVCRYLKGNTKDTNNFVIHLNSKEIKLPFIVRTRKDGDLITPFGMNGSMKLKKYFKKKNYLMQLLFTIAGFCCIPLIIMQLMMLIVMICLLEF